MENNQLYHHGTKGMKWGVRRFQNADGSLTPAGKKRYDRDVKDLSDHKKKKYVTDPNKWVKEDIKSSKTILDETAQLSNKMRNINDSKIRNSSKKRMDLSKMTDAQMRERINREMLERQYDDVFNPKKTSRGREFASNVLEAVGTTLTIGASALSIALAVRELRGD